MGNPEPIIVTHSRPIDHEPDDDSRFWEPRLTTMREEAKREISAIPDICYDLIARTVVAGFHVSTNVDSFKLMHSTRRTFRRKSGKPFRTTVSVLMNTKSRTRKILVILNGKVAGDDTLRTAIVRQRAAGRSIEVRVTWENGDARRFVSETDKVDLLIAAGGDGTLNEVVHGLMDLSTVVRPVLGVVPLGTANDFATGCSIPSDPEKALALCLEGEAVAIDVGRANEHWFLNAANVGFGAEVASTTSPELKRLLGPAAYTVMGAILAMNVHQYHGRLILPDRKIIGSGPVAIVGNGRQTGGGFQVAPHARIDDGLLDVLVVRHIPASALLTAARELQQLSPEGEYISYWQTPWAEVHPEEAIPVNLDGESIRFASVRYEAVPRAIRLIVPPSCPLLSATVR